MADIRRGPPPPPDRGKRANPDDRTPVESRSSLAEIDANTAAVGRLTGEVASNTTAIQGVANWCKEHDVKHAGEALERDGLRATQEKQDKRYVELDAKMDVVLDEVKKPARLPWVKLASTALGIIGASFGGTYVRTEQVSAQAVQQGAERGRQEGLNASVAKSAEQQREATEEALRRQREEFQAWYRQVDLERQKAAESAKRRKPKP